jgi:Transposase DDE domain
MEMEQLDEASALLEQITHNITALIENEDFITAHKASAQCFTRKRVFSFKVLLCFLMTNLQKSLQREIALFSEAILSEGGSIPEVHKSAFCKARKKLRHSAFVQLSEVVTTQFYQSAAARTWKGFRLLGVDGSMVELPNSKDIQEHYGVFQYRSDGKATCMGRTLMLYDTINHLTLYGALDKLEVSEPAMLLQALAKVALRENDLLIFDRLYASRLLFLYLQSKGVQFCFRMKNNWWKVVESFYNSEKTSQVISVEVPQKDKAKAAALGITTTTMQCRLVRIELEGGETEILLTSLTDEQSYSVQELKQCYGWRWPVEEAYKVFKHKVCIENFTGKSCTAVLQDFHVKVFIMNLTAAAVQPINKALEKSAVKVKHPRQVNLTEALFSLKKAVVSFFVSGQITQAVKKFCSRLAKITEPIRRGRKYKRYRQPHKRKYPMNYKPV